MTAFDALFARRTLGIRLGLPIVAEAYAALGRPSAGLPAIVVVGTNGKGSIAAMCDHLLRARGHRVGLYTSPHLVRVTERVRIDGIEIDQGRLQENIARVLAVESRAMERRLSFFEVLTLAALCSLHDAGVQMLVIEAGLGGRLDATRLVSPRAVAVASIDLDHQAMLGRSRAAIAREKAGMFAAGATIVTGHQDPEAEAVLLQMASLRGCPVREVLPLADPPAGLPGDHQRTNAAVALGAAAVLDPGVTQADLQGVRWPARLQTLAWGRGKLVLDAAHNLGGVRALADHLADHLAGHLADQGPMTIVFGAQADKPAREMIGTLASLGPIWWVALEPDAAAPNAAQRTFGSPHDPHLGGAMQEALERGGTLVVCGSHRLLGAVMLQLGVSPSRAGTLAQDPGESRGA